MIYKKKSKLSIILFVCLMFSLRGQAMLVKQTLINSNNTIKASLFGYKTTNSTKAFTEAINSECDTIIIDKQIAPWIIEPTNFYGLNNKTIIFEKGVILKAKKNTFKKNTDKLLQFINSEDIMLIGDNSVFSMDKADYKDGEWRHTLSIIGSKNIHVSGIRFEDSGGDGIYIAGSKKNIYSKNIYIKNIESVNHKRQGMSIISVENLYVEDAVFSNTKGTLPGAGIDIEPNYEYNRIVNVNFNRCSFIKNDHSGILLALTKLNSSSTPVSISFKNCYLSYNHNPENKYKAGEISINAKSLDPVGGKVLFEDCLIEGSNWGILHTNKSSKAFEVIFKKCAAINISKKNENPPIHFVAPNKYGTFTSIGGFSFDDLLIQYDSNLPFLKVETSFLGRLKKLENINGSITIINSNTNGIEYSGYNPSLNENVKIDYIILKDK